MRREKWTEWYDWTPAHNCGHDERAKGHKVEFMLRSPLGEKHVADYTYDHRISDWTNVHKYRILLGEYSGLGLWEQRVKEIQNGTKV